MTDTTHPRPEPTEPLRFTGDQITYCDSRAPGPVNRPAVGIEWTGYEHRRAQVASRLTEADLRAIASDWHAVGDDLQTAMNDWGTYMATAAAPGPRANIRPASERRWRIVRDYLAATLAALAIFLAFWFVAVWLQNATI